MDNTSLNLLDSFKKESFYPHRVENITLIETHISWVVLTGEFVYKIKKPVNLGFLDFSTLENRQCYCNEELRLNKRLAPDYYLDVVSITGSSTSPELNGSGEVIEYAVKMRQFPQESQLDRMMLANNLNSQHMLTLAHTISQFHNEVDVAAADSVYGDLDHVHTPVLNCYQDILDRINDQTDIDRVQKLKAWSNATFEKLKPILMNRKAEGFVRECHGDLHLRNIAIDGDQVIAFDCIEFNPDLRWIDVISEIAFLIMDLDDHGRTDLAYEFLNQYLENTGDFKGLSVLNYYLVYRAIVRAMVSAIRMKQEDISEQVKNKELLVFREYLTLAERYVRKQYPKLILTCGFSGSGKTFIAKSITPLLPAIHVRSDVERKRLFSMKLNERASAEYKAGIYSAEASEKTYRHLQELAKILLNAGYSVVIDATFLKYQQRHPFQVLAHSLEIDFRMLQCYAPKNVMQDRISKRLLENKDASDADLAILEYQISAYDEFTEKEQCYLTNVDTSRTLNFSDLLKVSEIRVKAPSS